MKQDFNFNTNTLDLMKAENEDYFEIEGIASTADEDLEEEIVKQNFDLSLINKDKGYFIADHGQNYEVKDHARMGVIDEAKITKKGLWIKGKIWKKHPEAVAYYNELKYKPGAVQFSVEGYTLERNPFNKNIVEKAVVTGVALTRNPVNQNTYAKLAKSLSSKKENELELGKKIESEHKDTIAKIIADVKAGQTKSFEEYFENIAEDHIEELKDYYTRLVKMESEAKEEMEKGGVGSGRRKTAAEIEEEKRKKHHAAETAGKTKEEKVIIAAKEGDASKNPEKKMEQKQEQEAKLAKPHHTAAPEEAKNKRRMALQAERTRAQETAGSKEEKEEELERINLKTRPTARRAKERGKFTKSEFQAELIRRSLISPDFKKSLETVLSKALATGGPAAATTLPDARTNGQVFQQEEIVGVTNKKCPKCKDKKCACKGKN